VSGEIAARSWADEIDVAMVRGKSPWRATDLLRWLREGSAGLAMGEDMHASWVFEGDVCTVGHVYGRWNADEMAWFVRCMERDMAARGVRSWRWSGRPGWARFLRSKGWQP